MQIGEILAVNEQIEHVVALSADLKKFAAKNRASISIEEHCHGGVGCCVCILLAGQLRPNRDVSLGRTLCSSTP
jgi:hypothetical protein